MTETIAAAGLSTAAASFVRRTHQLFIDGEWRPAADGATFPVYNPSTSTEVARAAQAGPSDVDAAVKAARRALSEGPWATMTAAYRSVVMNRLANLLEENADEFAEIEALDNGKPLVYAKAVDIAACIDELRYFAGWPTKLVGETAFAGENDSLYYSLKQPVGVCALIVPWNYPLLMGMWKIAPALAAGCTIVLKPAEQTPLAALRFAELAVEAGVPAGVLNVLTGDGATGSALVDHPGVQKIAFTGSTAVGREIGAKAGRALKRVTLELGGKSPNIILPDADLEAAIAGSYSAIYFNTGQSCNAGSRLFVPAKHYDEVMAGLSEMAHATTPLPGLHPDSTMGPVVSREQFDTVNRYIASGIDEGAELVAGGIGEDPDHGWFIKPTLFSSTDDSITVAREEIFGPVLVASPYDDIDDVIARANATEYGLVAGLWTRDVASAHKIAAKLEAGTVYVNRWAQFGPHVPFGGVKSSGIGREHGSPAVEAYLEHKSVLIDLS